MNSARYVVRPLADFDLDELAFYYTTAANNDLGQRFLAAAHDTFALLAEQPQIGWHSRIRRVSLREMRVFRVKGFGKILVLYLPLPNTIEVLRVIHGSRNLHALLRRRLA